MNILLTGGLGYIGSHTALSLIAEGHKVILYDNLVNSKKEQIAILERISGRSINFVYGDIRNTDLISSTLKNYGVDSVIHFAGLKSVEDSFKNPIKYFDNNVFGTISLLKAMELNNLRTIVFSSSATVYGELLNLPVDENHKSTPLNPYGKAKKYIEDMLEDLSKSNDKWKILNLRYFNPVGAHQSGLIGESLNNKPNNLMPIISLAALGKLPFINVYGDDYQTIDGSGVRDYIHISDLADGHVAALQFLLKGNSGCNAINLGTGKGHSVLEVIAAFSKISGKKINYKIVARRSGDVPSCYASISKASKLLNWHAKADLKEMCKSQWNWIKKNHE